MQWIENVKVEHLIQILIISQCFVCQISTKFIYKLKPSNLITIRKDILFVCLNSYEMRDKIWSCSA